MRNFLLSSLLLFFMACAQSPYRSLQIAEKNTDYCLTHFEQHFKPLLFNTHAYISGHHLSGLLLIKEMPDSSIRVVFSNEMGLKYFDFEYSHSKFKVIYCIHQLNRKIVLNLLRKDLGLLIGEDIDFTRGKILQSGDEYFYSFIKGKEQTYYVTDKTCTELKRIEQAYHNTKKVIMNFKGFTGSFADSVYIAHQTFDFNISLRKLER